MKIATKIILFFVSAGVAFYFSCRKPQKYPVEPYIGFISLDKISNNLGFDDRAVLKFSFTDGDGDIGLDQSDTVAPYNNGSPFYYNLFIDYYEKQNGVWKQEYLVYFNKITLNSDTVTLNSRIPVVTPRETNISIKGEIVDTFYINNYDSEFDTVYFEISVADRALNISNKIRTPDIIIKKK